MTLDTPITVLGRNTSSNVQKVMWLLAEINRGCERIDVGGKYGGKKGGATLATTRTASSRRSIHGDIVIWESNTILRYLANVFRLSELYPNGHAERANVERWMDWQLSSFGPANVLLYQSIVRTPIAERNEDVIEQHRARNATHLAILEQTPSNHRFIAGDKFTLGDVSMGALVHRWFKLSVMRPDHPHLRGCYDSMCERRPFVEHVVKIEFS
ncbi:glutathione binding-like protein [Paraburkholderia youngii]|uniref:glutathione binding-like protein n=1 Tax=Paraburkholderia youngii TaxID=2782701 RepID=UPI0020D1B551|nr:glutathione binding-like protein [Paraburkholderia youngii]